MIMRNDAINNIIPGRIFYIDFVMQHINSPQTMLLFYFRNSPFVTRPALPISKIKQEIDASQGVFRIRVLLADIFK